MERKQLFKETLKENCNNFPLVVRKASKREIGEKCACALASSFKRVTLHVVAVEQQKQQPYTDDDDTAATNNKNMSI